MSDTPNPYLLAWRLEGRKVVVVGGGSIGTAKVETLLDTGARIVVVDPIPSARAADMARLGLIELKVRRARPTDMVGAALVVAATGDSAVNRRIRRWAKPFGAVVNAVDDKENCDVTVPAVVKRGPATIAITTGGASPAGARFLREELTDVVAKAVPEELTQLFDHAAVARHNLRERGEYRYDYAAWRQLYFEPGLAAIRNGRGAAVAEVRRRFEAEFAGAVTPLRSGTVTLVGAGPGGADLITVRGANALAAADVVVYDRLSDPELLALAPAAAERIPVGKGKGYGTSQEDINQLLIDRASAGNNVVRLKGGDPFVFGRGGEEADAVAAAGLSVSVVPGLSSSVSGPALAGIPVTDRRYSSSFTVITGHDAGLPSTDAGGCGATGSTLVALMAASTADRLADRLLDAGRPAFEPVAFVHAAGTPDQKVARQSLSETAEKGCPFPSPTVMVVGAVAALGSEQGEDEAIASMARTTQTTTFS